MSSYDFAPTLLDYLSLPVPGDYAGPGESYRGVLTGEDDAARDRVVVHSEYGTVRMIRTEDWKYVHRYPRGPHELYDLANDPDERENLIDDPGQESRVASLREDLADWFGEYADPALDGARFPVTGKGQKTRIDDENPGEGVFYPRE